jgi:ribulose-phosphate 3-epimerase
MFNNRKEFDYMAEISASVLTVEKDNATHTFYNLETSKIDYFHIDVMDGKFVEKNNQELMKDYALTISHISNIGLDVHLMVENVEENIDEYIMLEPEIITFHIEATKDRERTMAIIEDLKANNIKVGIAINPDTSIDEIKPFLPYIHVALVMTVVPGKGGQTLIPSTIEKVKELKKYIDENEIDIDIEVDGGINSETSILAKDAGANILVAGNYIISSDNFKEAVEKLK